MTGILDTHKRCINYLRISVTDRCNLHCTYCYNEEMKHLPRLEILSYEEINKVVQAAVGLGIRNIRLTGGEPLVRPYISRLVEMISKVEGINDISMTTNGTLLRNYASHLRKYGLRRVNISLDTLKPERFKAVCGSDSLTDVVAGIQAARIARLEPVKLNTVVLRGVNDDEVTDFARMTINAGWNVRFIEHMPLAEPLTDESQRVTIAEITEEIEKKLGKLEPVYVKDGKGPARYYRLPKANGTIGFISPMTECFCSECNRIRLTADGKLRPCLIDDSEVDMKEALRGGASIEELRLLIRRAVESKPERHLLNEDKAIARPMHQIGG